MLPFFLSFSRGWAPNLVAPVVHTVLLLGLGLAHRLQPDPPKCAAENSEIHGLWDVTKPCQPAMFGTSNLPGQIGTASISAVDMSKMMRCSSTKNYHVPSFVSQFQAHGITLNLSSRKPCGKPGSDALIAMERLRSAAATARRSFNEAVFRDEPQVLDCVASHSDVCHVSQGGQLFVCWTKRVKGNSWRSYLSFSGMLCFQSLKEVRRLVLAKSQKWEIQCWHKLFLRAKNQNHFFLKLHPVERLQVDETFTKENFPESSEDSLRLRRQTWAQLLHRFQPRGFEWF